MKKIILILLFLITMPVYAKLADSKNLPLSADNAFMVVLNTISDMNYKINEIQSDSGYILFQSNEGNEYLIMVSKKDENTSNVKIQKLRIYAPLNEISDGIFAKLINNMDKIPIKAD